MPARRRRKRSWRRQQHGWIQMFLGSPPSLLPLYAFLGREEEEGSSCVPAATRAEVPTYTGREREERGAKRNRRAVKGRGKEREPPTSSSPFCRCFGSAAAAIRVDVCGGSASAVDKRNLILPGIAKRKKDRGKKTADTPLYVGMLCDEGNLVYELFQNFYGVE